MNWQPHLRAARLPVAAAVVALLIHPAVSVAQGLTEEVPIVGGTTAVAHTLGIAEVPDRPRFLAELVRVIYDAREGQNVETDTKLARLASQRSVTDRFQASLAAVQPGTTGISLAMAAQNDRERLKEFLDLVGLRLREKNKAFTVEPTASKQAAGRVKLLADLGIDLGKLAGRLNAGETVRIQVATETVPVPLTAKLWSEAIFQQPVSSVNLFAAILADRRAALLAHGLAAVDDETLGYLAEHPAILTRLYEEAAASFAAFGDALRIRGGRVVPAGGPDGIRAWEAVVGEKVMQPDRFIHGVFAAHHGRVALLYQALVHLDPAHVRFALGGTIPDVNARVDQFKELVAAEVAREEWDVELRPFVRPVNDASMLISRVRVLPNGAPAGPLPRVFWHRAFESAALLDDPASRLRNLQEDGVIDAGWLAQNVTTGEVRIRGDRFEQLRFGQRVFAAVSEADLPNALLAVRSVVRFRMLMLAIDRIGVRNAGVYAAAAHQADRLAALDAQHGYVALAQFQAAVALVGRLVRVHSLSPAAAATLTASIAAVPLVDEGEYAGAMARWIERALIPALSSAPVDDSDALLVRALAGGLNPDTGATTVAWEGRAYTVDLVSPEQRRLTRALDKMAAPSMRLALQIEHLATRLSASTVAVPAVRESLVELRAIAAMFRPVDKKTGVIVPPGIEPPKGRAEIVSKVLEELTQISQPKDLKRAARAAAPLFGLADTVLADALLSLAYALDIGNPDGTTLMGGNVSRRHDFGFDTKDRDKRTRAAWALPARVVAPGVPWHVAGSLLGLDAALSSLALRRIDAGEVPAAPTLTSPDRETFTKTLAWMNPFDMTDADRDGIVAAIGRGRARVAAVGADGAGWDDVADQISMDGWRRRAGRWALTHERPMVPSFFSLVDLLHLGAPPADLHLDAWGMASDVSDACICTEAPVPGRAALVVGRPHLGLLASEVGDVNLHVAEILSARHLPASLAQGVLAAAIQDYIEQVRPMHPSDWLTLVRAAQAISDDRLDDYVAALTADGPLAAAPAIDIANRRQQ